MRRQESLTGSMALGPSLVSMPGSPEPESESQYLEDQIKHAATADGLPRRSEERVADARCARPRVVTVGPMLTLLLTLRRRGDRPPRREWNLPPGCVLAVRYRSR